LMMKLLKTSSTLDVKIENIKRGELRGDIGAIR
jgi:hypothetical protein